MENWFIEKHVAAITHLIVVLLHAAVLKQIV